jgi:hypothetical protein
MISVAIQLKGLLAMAAFETEMYEVLPRAIRRGLLVWIGESAILR